MILIMLVLISLIIIVIVVVVVVVVMTIATVIIIPRDARESAEGRRAPSAQERDDGWKGGLQGQAGARETKHTLAGSSWLAQEGCRLGLEVNIQHRCL